MNRPATNRNTLPVTSRMRQPDAAAVPAQTGVFRVMTYNVHSFLGTDGVYDPERIARIVEAARANVVALQEVDFGRGPRVEASAVERLAERLGMQCHFAFTRDGRNGHFGNAVLTPHSLSLVDQGLLPRRRDEARAVQWVRIVAGDHALELFNTHLSVSFRERRAQVAALLGERWLGQAAADRPLVVCGDFNASPWSSVYRRLARNLRDIQARGERHYATWPSRLPFWRIDHIFVSPALQVRSWRVVDDALARHASDHLPLLAELEQQPLRQSP